MLNENEILAVLNDWNFWRRDISVGILRPEYLRIFSEHFPLKTAVSVVGLRRSGKSTLMLQFAKQLIDKKKISAREILYVNFEEPRFFGNYSLTLLSAIYEVYQQNLSPEKRSVIFLDEVQNIIGWEKFVNSLLERRQAKVFVSGSNASLLSSEFSTTLTGRQTVLKIYPLTFREFLIFNKLNINSRLDFVAQEQKIKKLFSQFWQYGGLPEVTLARRAAEKKLLLRNYFNDIINRDLIERFKIRQTDKLKVLVKFYFTNIASLVSFNKIKNFLQIPLVTVERFSEYLTTPFLIYFVNKFSYSLKEQAVNPRKVYVADVGLRNIIASDFTQDRGKILENIIFLHLLKQEDSQVFYYRTKTNAEVDFLVKQKKDIQLIQVAWTVKDFTTREREINSLFEALKELGLRQGLILTNDEEEVIKKQNITINVYPAYKWLLE